MPELLFRIRADNPGINGSNIGFQRLGSQLLGGNDSDAFGMISAFFVYSQKGELLVCRLIRDGIKRSVADVFRIQVISSATPVAAPVLTLGSTTFFHIKCHEMFFVAVTRSNVDASIAFEYLNRIIYLIKVYCSGSLDIPGDILSTGALLGSKASKTPEIHPNDPASGVLTESVVKQHVALIYELLDETLDFGYPQLTELDALKLSVTAGSARAHSTGYATSSSATTATPNQLARHATSAVSWRRPGIKYRRNEVFLDIVEQVNLLISSSGQPLHAYVDGRIQMKSHLSGMPECRFGLNDALLVPSGADPLAEYDVKNKKALPAAAAGAVSLEDYRFHQCVDLDDFDVDRSIRFIPPDGEFELMSYRCTDNVNIPFQVVPQVREIGRSQLEYSVKLKSLYSSRMYANDVVVSIPVPPNAVKQTHTSSGGKVKYDPSVDLFVWKFSRVVGGADFSFSAMVELSTAATLPRSSSTTSGVSVRSSESLEDFRDSGRRPDENYYRGKTWSRPPVSMQFNITMFSCSGLVVRYLKIEERNSKYKTVKWVRYMTTAGSYEIRY